MKKKIRVLALLAVLAAMVVGAPSGAKALLGPNMPGMTFPENAGGYQTLSLTASGYADPLVTIRINLGTPPCVAAGCGFGPVLGTTTADLFGIWSVAITLPSEGQHRLYVFANNGFSDSVPLVRDIYIDVTAPAAPTIDLPLGGETFPSRVVPVSGTGEARAMIVVLDEAGLVRRATAADDGTWSMNAIFTAGPHTISAYQNDLAFNTSPISATVSFVVDIDVIPPVAPVIVTPAEGALLPATVTVSGTAEPLSSVEVLEDTITGFIIYATDEADALGDWSVTLTLSDGTHVLEARATDASGNLGPRSAKRTFRVDAIKPDVKIFKTNPYLVVQLFYFDGDPIKGSATDNVAVASVEVEYSEILIGNPQSNTAVCPLCPAASVRWQDKPSGLAPGLYSVTATAVDLVGNVSDPYEILVLVVI